LTDVDHSLTLRKSCVASLRIDRHQIGLSDRHHRNPQATGNDAGAIAYIFEKGDVDQDDVNRCWGANFAEYGLNPIFLKKADQLPGHSTVESIRPFEAADLLSYESLKVNKTIKKQGSVLFENLRMPMQQLSRLPGSADWKFFEGTDLEIACEIYHVPKRT
jgi:hypothetical protein